MQTIKILITDAEKEALHALSLAKKKPIADFIKEAIDVYLAGAELSFEEALNLTQGICKKYLSVDRREWEERNNRFFNNEHDFI